MQTPDVTFGQTVIVTKGLDVRDKVRAELQDYLNKTFIGTDAFVKLLDIGPPVGKPVQYRLSGPDIQKVRELGQQLSGIVGEHRLLSNMVMDWNEPTRVVKVDVLQDKARQQRLLGRHRQCHEQHCRGVHRHAGEGRYLSRQRGGAGAAFGARLHRDLAKPAIAGNQRQGRAALGNRQFPLWYGAADHLAS